MTDTDTTQSSPEAVRCDHCGGALVARRPSLSGAHFCARPKCQAAKQRFHYRRRRDGIIARDRDVAQERLDLLSNVLFRITHTDRVACEDCGRADAVPGVLHPMPDWSTVCRGTELADSAAVTSDVAVIRAISLGIWDKR